ncbi:efflux RND transporter permease subunit [Paludibacterium paludis]|uniref:Nodulation protein NolG n=1 Tax=Paludibacterium paludis TaxID=1225769 RepID=A0A918U7J8_9NEIS|nr:efflux RND transporter permease subunit [Paludibacterium paludis]GGY07682.1 nodulation protein NolG [Paludibacterium paludis]
MWLTRVSVRNPYFAAVLMMALVVLGGYAWLNLSVEKFPDIRFPVAVISTTYDGASPEVVENEVTRKIEEAVNTVSGIESIRSYSMPGESEVVVQFQLGVNPAQAIQDVRDRMGGVQSRLRREISTPSVSQADPNDNPFMVLSLSNSEVSPRVLSTWVDKVFKKRMQSINGMGRIRIFGQVNREIRVNLDPYRLEAAGLSIPDVSDAIRNANKDYPAGSVSTARNDLAVRITGKIKNVDDFANLNVGYRNGSPIRLSDVAQVEDAEADRNSVSLIDGAPGVGVSFRAARGANLIGVADGVHKMIGTLKAEMPPGTKVHISHDDSRAIKRSLQDVQAALIEGALLTVLIVFLFLGSWRSTVITGLTLPVALIGTMFAVWAAGFTLNLLTLMALSLSIGLLIDDAIVVRENIVRHAAMGKSHFQAALDGTNEIGLAVFATTLTIVAVFLPVGFMGGVIGKFFHQFGLTVTVAVLISMLVSFTLDPMLSSIWHDPHHHGDKHKGPFGRLLDWFEGSLDRLGVHYEKLIRWSLGHRKTVVFSAILVTVGSFALVPLVGGEFMPRQDSGQFVLTYKTAPGSTLEYTTSKGRELEVLVRAIPEVKSISLSVGNGNMSSTASEGELEVDVGTKDSRKRSLFALMDDARKNVGKVAGVEVSSIRENEGGGGGGGGKPVYVALRGSDITELARAADIVSNKLAGIKGVKEIQSSLTDADPALSIDVKRDDAASLGIDLSRVGTTLQTMLAGDVVTNWEAPDGESYDVRVQIPKNLRNQDMLDVLTVAGNRDKDGSAAMVPLSTVSQARKDTTPRQIDRVDLQREIAVTANISGRDPGSVFADIASLTKSLQLPPGVTLAQSGQSKDMQESLGYALQALGMGICFIYMILAAQFRSFTLPITIMMALPLSFVGVFVALFLWGSTLNMFSVIGIVMLMGLATKNGILLVDFVNQARREGMAREAAIIEAGRVRLRPILMTSFAMIFGMLPAALSHGEGSETQGPMAHAIIGGLVTSTLLTLIVVPVVYTYMDSLRSRIRRLIGAGDPSAPAALPDSRNGEA